MQMRTAFRIAAAPDGTDDVAGIDVLTHRDIRDRGQMRVTSDDPVAMIDPDLPPTDAVERRRWGIPQLHRVEHRDTFALAVPVDEVAIRADHRPRGDRAHGRPRRG